MEKISSNLKLNKENLQKHFESNPNYIVKDFEVCGLSATVVYIEGLVDTMLLSDFVIKPCLNCKVDAKISDNKTNNANSNKIVKSSTANQTINIINHLKAKVILLSKLEENDDFNTIISEIIKGKGVLMVDTCNSYIILDLEKTEKRAISEPPTSAVTKGPRAGFVESIKTNISCIRKILATDKLKIESKTVGKYSNTQVAVLYLDGIADKSIVHKVLNKISKINIDGVIDSYYISSFLEEHKYSIFKEIGQTEKPDIVSAKMLEGRICILVDGSPIALTLPFMLFEDIQNSNDYYSEHNHTSFVRVLRLISIFITIVLPGFYIAIQLHHYKAFPLKFLITIINSTQNLPLTPFLEMLLVLVLFEILYEASLRMPKYMGIAMSIVGALILGDTAVKAGLVSPPAVMIVAVSGITLYTVPDLSEQISILRFVFTIVGGVLGIFGMVLFGLYILIYLNDFDSFGVSYLSPYAPYVEDDTKDGVFQRDLLMMRKRPKSLNNKNKTRLKRWKNY